MLSPATAADAAFESIPLELHLAMVDFAGLDALMWGMFKNVNRHARATFGAPSFVRHAGNVFLHSFKAGNAVLARFHLQDLELSEKVRASFFLLV